MAARSFTQECSQTDTQPFILTRCTHSHILCLTVGPYRFYCLTHVAMALLWLCALLRVSRSTFLPCSTFHKLCSTLWLLTGVLLALTPHQTTFQVPANFYWLDFLLGTFHSGLSYSGLRNNTIFILSSLNIKGMEAVNKVESFAHNSHTTKYPPYPQCSWNSDSLSWDKQLASSDMFSQSVSFFTDVQLLQLIPSNFLLQGWSLVCVV